MNPKRPVILIGGGGHAKVLLEILKAMKADILGLTDFQPPPLSSLKWLGPDRMIENYPAGEIQLVNGVGSTRVYPKRQEIFDYFKRRGYAFATLVHPSAILAGDVRLGEGTQIMAGVVVQPGVKIGKNCILNTRTSVDHDCQIHDHVHVAPGVTLSGNVIVGAGSHLGTGAIVVQGISLPEKSFIKAGIVVTSSDLYISQEKRVLSQ